MRKPPIDAQKKDLAAFNRIALEYKIIAALTIEPMRITRIVKITKKPTPLVSERLKDLMARGDVKEEEGLYSVVESE